MAAAKINRQCEVDQCFNKHDSHGFCSNHAAQFRKYGHPLSAAEVKQHYSESNKGKKQTLGKTWSIKDTSKMKGKHPSSEFQKGSTPHNKSKKFSQELREKISRATRKYTDLQTASNKQQRRASRKLREAVLNRDNHTCVICTSESNYLQVDHIKRWSEYPELRFEMDNLRTVCMPCHYYITYKRKLPEGAIWGHNLSRRIAS